MTSHQPNPRHIYYPINFCYEGKWVVRESMNLYFYLNDDRSITSRDTDQVELEIALKIEKEFFDNLSKEYSIKTRGQEYESNLEKEKIINNLSFNLDRASIVEPFDIIEKYGNPIKKFQSRGSGVIYFYNDFFIYEAQLEKPGFALMFPYVENRRRASLESKMTYAYFFDGESPSNAFINDIITNYDKISYGKFVYGSFFSNL